MLRRDAVLTWDWNQSVDERDTFIRDTAPPLRAQTGILSLALCSFPLGQSGSSGGFVLMNVKSNNDLFRKHFHVERCTKAELKGSGSTISPGWLASVLA